MMARPSAGRVVAVIATILSALWYTACAASAIAAGVWLAQPGSRPEFAELLPWAFGAAFVLWQFGPLLVAMAGASLDLKRLLVYPVPSSQLLLIELMLRTVTVAELAFASLCAMAGLAFNPSVPWYAPLALVSFVAMNLMLNTGLRYALMGLLAKGQRREWVLLLLVCLALTPRLLAAGGVPEWLTNIPPHWTPWWGASAMASGLGSAAAWTSLLGWTAAACAFGRWQFLRHLRRDSGGGTPARTQVRRAERFFNLSRLFPDPMGAMVEKELRSLTRTPRFRVVFAMGFTFGILIWLPTAVRGSNEFGDNYLTFVACYALLLLGEVLFWNAFGFDRTAAQIYYLAPVPLKTVLVAKNTAAAVFIGIEVAAVAIACWAARFPVTAGKLAEAYAVCAVLGLFLMGAGNLGSIYHPRPMSPRDPWRSRGGKFALMMVALYPLLAAPVGLAYLARWAFASNVAFALVLLFAAGLGVLFYRIALESAIRGLERRREPILAALSVATGPAGA